jgi:hypothetical protein
MAAFFFFDPTHAVEYLPATAIAHLSSSPFPFYLLLRLPTEVLRHFLLTTAAFHSILEGIASGIDRLVEARTFLPFPGEGCRAETASYFKINVSERS